MLNITLKQLNGYIKIMKKIFINEISMKYMRYLDMHI